jgi:hypothetical protein
VKLSEQKLITLEHKCVIAALGFSNISLDFYKTLGPFERGRRPSERYYEFSLIRFSTSARKPNSHLPISSTL